MKLEYILKLIRHTLRAFPLWYAAVVLALVSVGVELVALSALFPLAEAAAGRGVPSESFWPRTLSAAGVTPGLSALVALFFGLLLLRAVTLLVTNSVFAHLWRKLIAHFASQAFETFVRTLTFAEINDRSIGYFTSLAGDDAYRAAHIATAVARLFPAVVLAIMYFAAIAYQSPPLAAAVVVFLALAGLSLGGATRRSHDLGTVLTNQARDLSSHFLDTLNSLRTVRALTAEGFVSSRYAEMLRQSAVTGFKIDFTNLLARFGPVLFLLAVGVAWAAFALRSTELSANLPFLLIVFLLLMRFFPALGQVVDTFLRLVADAKISHDVSYLLERGEQWRTEQATASSFTNVGRIQRITFRNVTFGYDPGKPILRNLGFEMRAGKSYALVGASGTGKSTLIDLLLRFYDPQRGSVSINEIDAKELSLAALRSKVAAVEQQSRVFNDTVFHNIAFGRQTSLESVRRACRLASIDDDICALPQGYGTLLSYQGGNLSGGQRQRLVLARGLLGDCDVFILDESTNALDDATKHRVVGNLLDEFRDRLIVFVTHDQSVIGRVDVVIDLAGMSDAADGPSDSTADAPLARAG